MTIADAMTIHAAYLTIIVMLLIELIRSKK